MPRSKNISAAAGNPRNENQNLNPHRLPGPPVARWPKKRPALKGDLKMDDTTTITWLILWAVIGGAIGAAIGKR